MTAGRLKDAVKLIRKDNPWLMFTSCCIGGGGQPIHDGVEMAEDRGNILWSLDKNAQIRFSHENPDVQALYAEFLEKPLGHKSHHLLHPNHHGWEMPKNPKLK